jgi:hypothetical protein
MHLKPLSLLHSSPVDWLWTGRLAQGKLAVLDGDPGLEKSLFALDLCARLSTGRPFPEEAGTLETARSRSERRGQRERHHPPAPGRGGRRPAPPLRRWPDESGTGPSLRLPDQMALFGRALRRTKPRLVVIEPVAAFLDTSVCDSSDRGVRRALSARQSQT